MNAANQLKSPTLTVYLFFKFWTDFYFTAPQDAIVKTLVRNGVDTYMYVQNTTVHSTPQAQNAGGCQVPDKLKEREHSHWV